MIPIRRIHQLAMYYSFKAKQSKGLERLKYYQKAAGWENIAVRAFFDKYREKINSNKPPHTFLILLRSAFWLNLKALRLHWALIYLGALIFYK